MQQTQKMVGKVFANSQPWLKNRKSDLLFILLPLVLPIALILLFPFYFQTQTEVTITWWIILILSIDVAHVYSTLFRFYWESETFQKNKNKLIWIPLISFVIGSSLHFQSAITFWRTLAYLAVFHFVRQQYGFMRLYTRKENKNKFQVILDNITIYNATIYPVLYWHFYLTKELHWFIEGDFLSLPSKFAFIFTLIYWAIIICYIASELYRFLKWNTFNLPKNLLILGTYLSWHLGIITFKGDLIFTMLNVVSHGIPYMALVYFHSSKRLTYLNIPWKSIAVFIFTILFFAYLEEGLWDGFVWRDHEQLFPFFGYLPFISNKFILSLIVPILALPQITHYVLDGFIWKISKKNEINLI